MKKPPKCGRVFDDFECVESGDHLCLSRAAHAVAFFSEVLVHTKGRWARQVFNLADWQRDDIIVPLFGEVRWDDGYGGYVRRYRIAWIELARKNGKSELLAGIALYLLIADGEEGAEIYGCAKDIPQARKVFDVAARMVQLSPQLSSRLKVINAAKRIVNEATASYYECVASDASGNLGHNPHGIVFDEVISQPNAGLWDSMRTGMGARHQPLMVAATTAGDDSTSFAGIQHSEMLRIQDDPSRAPHIFAYCRNVPSDADPWDEANWHLSNPALESGFLSIDALREEALEASNDPRKENSFRQFRLNQWVQQATRWMPMHFYDQCVGDVWTRPDYARKKFAGRECWGGLDLAAKHDLTALCWFFPPTASDSVGHAMWRFWLPEDALKDLDVSTSGTASTWVKDGWLTLTEGSVLDYERVYADIEEDAKFFAPRAIDYDKWTGEPVRQAIAQRVGKLDMVAVEPTYNGMTFSMTETMSLTMEQGWAHHGNPIARWCFDNVEVKRPADNPDLIRPVKPERVAGGKRIDAVPATVFAVGAWKARGHLRRRRAAVGF